MPGTARGHRLASTRTEGRLPPAPTNTSLGTPSGAVAGVILKPQTFPTPRHRPVRFRGTRACASPSRRGAGDALSLRPSRVTCQAPCHGQVAEGWEDGDLRGDRP